MELPRKWEKVETKGENYSPRTGHTVVENHGDFYLFAGADSDSRTNDLFIFSLENRKWFKVNARGSAPTARSGAHSLSHQESIYIFGGYTRKGGEYFNDIFEYKTVEEEWVDLQALHAPPARTDHTFMKYQNSFYIYGGRDEMHIFSDIHEYKISENKWKFVKNQIISQDQVTQIIAANSQLQNISVLTEPKLRFGHSAVVHKNLMYVFGGWDGNVTLNDLNTFDLENNAWYLLLNVKGQIKGRYRHSATATENNMYIFGGIDQYQERFNDIHEFSFETQCWTRVITIGSPPSSRTFHQSLIFNGALFVMGGFDGMKRNDMYKIVLENKYNNLNNNEYSSHTQSSNKLLMNSNDGGQKSNVQEEEKEIIFTDEYFNNLTISQWIKLRPEGISYTPRTGHECIFFQNKIYLFGGTDDDDRKNDLHCYNIYKNKWEKMITQGNPPMPRSGAKGVIFKECLYFFGGYQKKTGDFYKDLFSFDLQRKKWDNLDLVGNSPCERTDHSAALYDGSLYIFGGYDGKTRFGDLYKCNLKSGNFKWRRIEGEGVNPLNRFGHTACIYEHSMFIFGGWNGHDTMDDIFQYSFASNYWYEIKRVKGIRPQPRYRHTSVVCNQSMIIFGGVDTNMQRFNDIYSYDFEKRKWSEMQVSGQVPQPRTFHRAVMFGNIMYVIGGFDGTRLNDIYHIALPISLYEEDSDSMRRISRPASSASGIMQTVPSDLPISNNGGNDNESKVNDIHYMKKQINLLKRQVKELSQILKQEEENLDDCIICYSRQIDTVFLECAHRAMCYKCAMSQPQSLKKCPICREEIQRIVKTYNV